MISLVVFAVLSVVSTTLQQVSNVPGHIHLVTDLKLGFQGDLSKSTVQSHPKQVLCMFDSWAIHREGPAKFTPNDIDPLLCTHVVFRLVELEDANEGNYNLKDNDKPESISVLYRQTIRLKERRPELKLLLSVGGWSEGQKNFRIISANYNIRKTFATNVALFLKKYNFDGVNIEWMWPDTEDDQHGVTDLIISLSSVLKAQQFLVALTLPAEISTIEAGYNIPALARELDYLIILGGDLYANWREVTGHNSALHGQAERNVGNTISFILKKNIPPSKVILGIPFNGRTWFLKDPNTAGNGLGAPVVQYKGIQGHFKADYQMFGYHEICYALRNQTNVWTVYEDEGAVVPFMRDAEGNWVSFEDVKSLEAKVKFGEKFNLGGYAAWPVTMDDFKGKFCDGKVNFPMLRTINYALTNIASARITKSLNTTSTTESYSNNLNPFHIFVFSITLAVSILQLT